MSARTHAAAAAECRYWRDTLAAAGRIKPVNVTATLCGLVGSAAVGNASIKGAVLYESALPTGIGYTLPMALTLAAQESLLPVTEAVLARHPCLGKFTVVHDLRIGKMPSMASRASAWRWAIDTLLPKCKGFGVSIGPGLPDGSAMHHPPRAVHHALLSGTW